MVVQEVKVGVLAASQVRQVEEVVCAVRLSFADARPQAVLDLLGSGWIVH